MDGNPVLELLWHIDMYSIVTKLYLFTETRSFKGETEAHKSSLEVEGLQNVQCHKVSDLPETTSNVEEKETQEGVEKGTIIGNEQIHLRKMSSELSTEKAKVEVE